MGKFNILSVNVILFQVNQKTGQNNAASGLFTKKFERFPDCQEAKSPISSDVFVKSQLFSKSALNMARSDTKFVVVRKILLSALR